MASINTNLPALTAQRNMGVTDKLFQRTVTRLSSGLRINNAADDAAGAFLGQKLKNQVRGLQQASRNAQDGVGLLQTAEGGLSVHNDILLRLRELAVQSSNGVMTDSDRALTIAPEVQALLDELTRVSDSTQFNGVKLLDGTMGGSQVTLGSNVRLANVASPAVTTLTNNFAATAQTGASLTSTFGVDSIVAYSSDPTRPDWYALQVTAYNAATDQVTVTLQRTAALATDAGQTGDAATTGVLTSQTIVIDDVSTIKGSQMLNFDQLGIAVYVNSKIGTDGLGVAQGLDRAGGAGNVNNNYFTVSANLANVDTDSADGQNDIDTTSVLSAGLQGVQLQVGANNDPTNQLTLLSMNDMSAAGLGLTQTIAGSTYSIADNVKTQAGSLFAIDTIDKAISEVAGARSRIGAYQNRLDYTITNLGVAAENQQAAVSRIFDADVASEVSELVRTQILSQSAMAILAQANSAPQALLSLFR